MTIFQPHAKKSFNYGLMLMAGFALIAALLSISLYNGIVNLRHSLALQETKLQELQTANADLKNRLYGILDAENLREIAGKLSLVKDNSPQYLETPWVFASQY